MVEGVDSTNPSLSCTRGKNRMIEDQEGHAAASEVR